MDDNTIFQRGPQTQPVSKPEPAPPITQEVVVPEQKPIQPLPPRPTQSIPVSPLQNPTMVKPMWQQQLPTQKPPPTVSADGEDGKRFPIGGILKAVIGIVVLLIIAFLVIRVVLPKFSKGSSQAVTLTYWGLWEDENVMRVALADFEKQNPTIKVLYTKQNIKDYRDRVLTRMQNGNGPDVFLFHNTWVPKMASVLTPLPTDVIGADTFQKTYYPVVVSDLTRNGAIYGIPIGIDTLALFINTEIFQNAGATPPTNWEDFGKVARSLTVKDEQEKIQTSGAAIGTFDNITHAPDLISLLFIQNGVDFFNLSTTSKSVSDALVFYTSFAKDEGKVWDDTLDPSQLAFAKGNLAMYFGYSWDIFTIKALSPNLSFQVVPVPHLPGRNTTIASYWANGVSIKGKHQKEALQLTKYLSQKDVAQKIFSENSKVRLFGEPYAQVELGNSLKSNKLVYPFVSQANNAASSYFASDTFDNGLNDHMNGYLGNAVRSILGNTSADTAVDTLIKGVAQVEAQYGQ